ncbi:luciferin 4-monooxygenase [Manduca sexta]|uniref:Luciferin 4-monooxygenase-like n=1 Tax=Manduca sexta TaxID=7130 RepID=A0A921ZEY5_MANSE|nr:luciferin 4-monooxygenase [Manduca sexta]KAG6456345.1 hypothetical protein O3G_MSEX009688 [Manduca sexta]
MSQKWRANDCVHWYMNEITSRIVAESGIPSDRHHLGKIILQNLKDDPEFLVQIDGGTDQWESSKSMFKRTVQCAKSMRNMGLKKGDVMVLMAPNHIDLCIPFYAALYLGVIVAAVDRTLGTKELRDTFGVDNPKIIFCQSDKAPVIQLVLNDLALNAVIVTFDKGDYLCSFSEFLVKYGDDSPIEEFRASDFDPEETVGFLIATSGTTGLPKAAAVTYKNFAITIPYIWSRSFTFPRPTRLALIGAPIQWLTAILHYLGTVTLKYPRLQSSQIVTQQHAYHLINTYKPSYTIFSPTVMTTLLKPGDREQCDFTCLEQIMLGGSAVPQVLVDVLQNVAPDSEIINTFGMTELACTGFHADNAPPGSCGKPLGCYQYRLINVETMEDIYEPNVTGELWMKGPGIFKEYYKNPGATEETFAEDRWFKTGDTFYRDENWNFFFVERIKLLLKYKSYQISPVELETVIREHPAVLDAAVSGIPDPECGDLPVASVVIKPEQTVTAQEIKNLVKETLSDAKALRGGVIFVNEIPMTASTKVHRRKLKEMVLTMDRE